ncbi:glycosyltransferase family 2 protein [uncultured Sunxiuqinia sp.]|uniref:glycosyltransferase family 2 protein n=1 Tax=uncultured Sunxiuqinia sp. TaxID=1573825 RepID=UPI002AA72853|nr:glycosyltransferase family 2 protein [uncultured Sunxiuqinia sp.]
MSEISVIILTYNEEQHIQRCIENVKSFSKDIFLVDSYSTDQTVEIAGNTGAEVFQNKWENNYAKQFNWGLENLPIKTKWILRLDADEYLLPELIDEIKQKLDILPENATGVVFKRRHLFLDKWMKRGTYPVKLLRLFQYKKAVCEQRWMDEHIQLLEGDAIEFEHDFVDHNLNNLSWWTQKHNGYAIREAIDLLDVELGLLGNQESQLQLSKQASAKRRTKYKYAKQPLFWRSFAYFIYRYFFKLGFLEGKEGFLWNFLQGWWYRTLVDAKIYEIKKACGTDKTKIKAFINTEYGLKL